MDKNNIKDLDLNVLDDNVEPIGRWYLIESKNQFIKGRTSINSYMTCGDNITTENPMIVRQVITKYGYRGVQFGIIENKKIKIQRLVIKPSQAADTLIIKELYQK